MFAVDTHKSMEILLAMEKFKYLEGRFDNHRSPAASKLHYALSVTEDDILTALQDKLINIPEATINTYFVRWRCVFDSRRQSG